MTWVLMFSGIFFAELPDKTSLATLALLRRYQGLLVWIGASSALISQTILAVTAGRLLGYIPKKPLGWIEITLFAGFAVWLWKESREQDDHESVGELPNPSIRRAHSVILQTFIFVFVAEFLDLTQIATMAFAAKYPHDLFQIALIASTALLAANAIVVLFGKIILRHISGQWIQRGAAILFGIIAALMGLSQLGAL